MSLDHLKKGNESSEPTINFQKTCWFSWICDSSMLGKTEPKVFFRMVVFHGDLHNGRIHKKSPLKKIQEYHSGDFAHVWDHAQVFACFCSITASLACYCWRIFLESTLKSKNTTLWRKYKNSNYRKHIKLLDYKLTQDFNQGKVCANSCQPKLLPSQGVPQIQL